MKHFRRLLREPLLHFLAIGGLIFLFFAMVAEPNPDPTDTIVIGPERIDQLAAAYQSVWQRPPTDDELRAIVDNFVREEVFYREGLALGLDRNDTIVRRRVQQKMEFLTDSGADLLEPSDDELVAYLAGNQETYERGPQLAFQQIYLGERPEPESITQTLSALQSDPATDPADMGERSLLPAQLGLSRPSAVDGLFGDGFFERLAELPAGSWTGPVTSGYGVHLVRIIDSLPTSMPSLEEVRDTVLRDWRVAKAQEIRDLQYTRFRERYVVEILGAESRVEETQ